jgi:hypothetical protein
VREGTCRSCAAVKLIRGRGLCQRCYQGARRNGTLHKYPRSHRLFSTSLQIAKDSETDEGCWLWPCVAPSGYPTGVPLNGVSMNAHVASWVSVNGPVPHGMTLDHLCHSNSKTCLGGPGCRHRRCVRPDHLEPVTPREQNQRSHRYRSPTCQNGHERSEKNVRWRKEESGRWSRQCRVCDRDNARRRRAMKLGLAAVKK